MLDLALGAWTIGWAIWIGLHFRGLMLSAGLKRFHPIMPELLLLIGCNGFLILWSALIKWRRPRPWTAALAMCGWLGISLGASTSPAQGAYVLPFLLSFLTLIKRY